MAAEAERHGPRSDDAELLNESAWLALYTGKVDDKDIAAGIKATQLSKDNPHILHTLACLYAEAGKTKEARDLLLKSMDDLNLDEPNDDYWYALGRIAEQYGERDIAMADYRKLEKPKQVLEIPTSTYELAQMRLKAMGGREAVGDDGDGGERQDAVRRAWMTAGGGARDFPPWRAAYVALRT